MNNHENNYSLFYFISLFLLYLAYEHLQSFSGFQKVILIFYGLGFLFISVIVWQQYFSTAAKKRAKILNKIKAVPQSLTCPDINSVVMGKDKELGINIHLPNKIRSRHVHVLGATGSGKTESVIINFLKQDVNNSHGAIILDAKGDADFVETLKEHIKPSQLKIFDLSEPTSLGYDPLTEGTPIEAAQRLFSALNWSEEYYKSKALSSLQILFQYHYKIEGKNPKLVDLAYYLSTPSSYAQVFSDGTKESAAHFKKEFMAISGLRDQINTLCLGHLEQTLSPQDNASLDIKSAFKGNVIYFRLQSLISPQIVSILGRLVINHLNYIAGTAHRDLKTNGTRFLPVYLDEFASFACEEFSDLISKARSAGFALHFSHQSIGDLTEVSNSFLNKITDNSATKIVLRINDPDSAEYMARSFGTEEYQKITQRVTDSKDVDSAQVIGEGTTRDAHRYRASPNLLKNLPTGAGSVLVAHGEDAEKGASSVFHIQFPKLN